MSMDTGSQRPPWHRPSNWSMFLQGWTWLQRSFMCCELQWRFFFSSFFLKYTSFISMSLKLSRAALLSLSASVKDFLGPVTSPWMPTAGLCWCRSWLWLVDVLFHFPTLELEIILETDDQQLRVKIGINLYSWQLSGRLSGYCFYRHIYVTTINVMTEQGDLTALF